MTSPTLLKPRRGNNVAQFLPVGKGGIGIEKMDLLGIWLQYSTWLACITANKAE
jgi:hypothetical protein